MDRKLDEPSAKRKEDTNVPTDVLHQNINNCSEITLPKHLAAACPPPLHPDAQGYSCHSSPKEWLTHKLVAPADLKPLANISS